MGTVPLYISQGSSFLQALQRGMHQAVPSRLLSPALPKRGVSHHSRLLQQPRCSHVMIVLLKVVHNLTACMAVWVNWVY